MYLATAHFLLSSLAMAQPPPRFKKDVVMEAPRWGAPWHGGHVKLVFAYAGDASLPSHFQVKVHDDSGKLLLGVRIMTEKERNREETNVTLHFETQADSYRIFAQHDAVNVVVEAYSNDTFLGCWAARTTMELSALVGTPPRQVTMSSLTQ